MPAGDPEPVGSTSAEPVGSTIPRPATGLMVGVLSDTHGYLYPEVKALLEGVDHIIHAGDVGSPDVLAGLGAMAPLTVVAGNMDHGPWAGRLPLRTTVDICGVVVLVTHIKPRPLDRDLELTGIDVVVSGHTHQPALQEREGVLFVNPGSAGPRRFGRPRSLARLSIGAAVNASEQSGSEPAAASAPAAPGKPRPAVRAEILYLDR